MEPAILRAGGKVRAADPRLDRLPGLLLVPRHGGGKLQRSPRGPRHQPGFRGHQGGSRGAAGRRPRGARRHGASRRADGLAGHGLHDAWRRCLRGRQLLSARATPRPTGPARRDGGRHATLREPERRQGREARAVSRRDGNAALRRGRHRELRGLPRQSAPRQHRYALRRLRGGGSPFSAGIGTSAAVAPLRADREQSVRRCGRRVVVAHLRLGALRRGRRWVSSLLRGRRLDDPAFREDALRQRPADRAAELGVAWHAGAPAQGGDRRLGRLAPARDATSRGRLRVEPRRPYRRGDRRKPKAPACSIVGSAANSNIRSAPTPVSSSRSTISALTENIRPVRCRGRSVPSATRTGAA